MTITNPMQLIIHPEPERSLSPYQQRMEKPFEVANDEFLGKDGVSFKTVLDTFNPLQQLPGISTAYRELTGDTISTGARLVGGALLGGPVGFTLALVNEIVNSATGKDIGANMFAALTDKYRTSEELA